MSAAADTELRGFRQRGFAVAAALLGVIVLAGALVLVTASGTHHVTRSAATPRVHGGVGAAPRRAPTASLTTSCPVLPSGSGTVPTVAPSAGWSQLGVMEVPAAPRSLGPARVSDGVGECFAHSPMGALYAAANVLGSFTAASQERVISLLAADTVSKASALAGARVGYNPTLQQQLGGTPSISGFSFASYSPAQADVDIVLSLASGAQPVVELSEVWQAGDWRFVVPPGGNLIGAQLSSLDGYVPWGSD